MDTFQVTIGASATQISKERKNAKQIIIQNNGSNNCAVGDSGSTITTGIVVAKGTPGTPLVIGSLTGTWDLEVSEYYITGTQGDTINVMIVD